MPRTYPKLLYQEENRWRRKSSAVQDDQHGDRLQPLNHQLQFEFDDEPARQPRWVDVNVGRLRFGILPQLGRLGMAPLMICTRQLFARQKV
jgi:hypothetical protein